LLKQLLKRFSRDKRGMAGPVIGLVVGMVVVVIAVIVGLILIGQFSTISASTNYGSSAANATAAAIFTNVYSAFNLMVIIPIIMAAGLVISVISVYFFVGSRK
jgi:uncharacterized membrane protein YjgN (DUF898 family)